MSLLRVCLLAAVVGVVRGGCMMYAEPQCLDCMMMNGTCSEMGNGELAEGEMNMCKNEAECLRCYWTGSMCMPVTSSGQMVMTFYTGHDVVILFDQWNVSTRGMYALAVILTFLACFGIALLKDFTATTTLPLPVRSVFMFIVYSGLYAAMLVTMTYNTGLFFAVIGGLTAGWGVTEAYAAHKSKVLGHEGGINADSDLAPRREVSCH